MSQIDEVKALTRDILEIYADWGTSEIQLFKFEGGEKDDLYSEGEPQYSKPYSCIGRYTITPEEEKPTDVGLQEGECFYTVYLVKDTLDAQGVEDVTVRDLLYYRGCPLDIISVQYSAVIGNYALQYKIISKGNLVELKKIGEENE